MFLFNTRTQDFPLSKVDIAFYEPNWKETDPIPDYFVEVEIAPFIHAEPHQTMMSNTPEIIDGKWIQTHYLRDLSQEEITLMADRKAQIEQRRLDLGLKPSLRPVTLDENGKIILDQYGQPFVEPVEE